MLERNRLLLADREVLRLRQAVLVAGTIPGQHVLERRHPGRRRQIRRRRGVDATDHRRELRRGDTELRQPIVHRLGVVATEHRSPAAQQNLGSLRIGLERVGTTAEQLDPLGQIERRFDQLP